MTPAIACGRLVEAILHVNTIVDITTIELPGMSRITSPPKRRNYNKVKNLIYKGLAIGRIAVVLMFLTLLARSQTTFDLSADFSLRDNPNKTWQYGYSEANSLAPDQFRFDKQVEESGPITF